MGNQNIDLSGTLGSVFDFLASSIGRLLALLGSVYVFHNVSVLHLLVALVILGMIISAVFVLFDGGLEDD